MIVPMKKITLLAMAADEDAVLSGLRSLGVMQIEKFGDVSGESNAVNERLLKTRQVISFLEKMQVNAAEKSTSGGEDICNQAADNIEKLTAVNSEISTLEQQLKAISMWGDFDRELLDKLTQQGIELVLCTGTKKVYEKIASSQDISLCQLIAEENGKYYFAVVGGNKEELPAIKLQKEDNPRELNKQLSQLKKEQQQLTAALEKNASQLPEINKFAETLLSELEFERVRDSFGNHEKIVSLQGFVPCPAVDTLRAEAEKQGWGLFIRDPESTDDVPVLMEYNRFTRWIKPLFDFLGITPGYREADASGGILIFFTIFYAMIVGDAGYGCLFLAGGGLGKWLLRKKPAARLPLNLLLLLSVFTIIWGALCGSWFGVTLGGISCLTNASFKDANIQAFCFLLAVMQLTMGRVWSSIKSRNIRKMLSDFGWILVLWGNFILTLRIIVWQGEFPVFMYWLFGIGLGLVVLFGINWKDIADVFQFPFAIINSFTDILSYIRLFAVGMSGACIAQSFNGMAMDVAKASPWFIIFSVCILLAGHLLNLVMAMMGVLVHAVRLNTLEFSNHMGLTWSGKKFRPFEDRTNKTE